jgi:epoxyqueuosine reductase
MESRIESTHRAEISGRIKSRGIEEGFDKIGIVPASVLLPERERLEEWLRRGYHASMGWMERDPEKRTDPTALLPAAKSVIVVALNYYTPHQHQNVEGTGKISRYAWGDDYHDVVGEKLKSLLGWIRQEWPGADGKICVDIQPMMDKAWAVRAGLGWIGKHSNLITKEMGSWVFIGEILLNLELDYDTDAIPDHCGTCTLCIDACPTGAITEPYVVDSNLCISHATIELRDEKLPDIVAENLEGWIYGCDICQDVCPWNRFEQPTDVARFEPRPGNVNPQLTDMASLTHEDYVRRFRHSAIKRAKLSGLHRNANELLSHENRSQMKPG